MQTVEGPALLFIRVVTPCYGTWDLCYMFALTYRVSLLRASVMAGVHLPGMVCNSAPKAMATFHMELMSIRLFSSKMVNSTAKSLGMLLPVCCPRTDRSQCCTRSKPARAAVGEHFSSKLTVEMRPVCLKLVSIPTLSTLLTRDLASCSEQTWALTKRCCNLFVPVFIILGYFSSFLIAAPVLPSLWQF